jgi:YidC/Oxa1 family membrane protein insertase
MERRVLVAIFLSFLVLYVYQAFVVKPKPAPAKPANAPASASAATPAPAPAETPPTPTSSAPAAPTATPLVSDGAEHDTVVETRDVIAVFSNRGGTLKSWRLKRYLDQQKQPLDLVVHDQAAAQPRPFSLRTTDQAITAALNNALYKLTSAPSGDATKSATMVAFEYRDSSGLRAVKQFRVQPSSYLVDLRATVTANDRPVAFSVEWGAALGDSDSQTGRYAVKPEALLSGSGKVQRLAANTLAKQPTYEDNFKYVGVDDHYFMAAALDTGRARVTYQPLSTPPQAGSKDPAHEYIAYSIETARPDEALKIYAGPKDFDTLKAIDPGLVSAVNFGMFTVIVVPLLASLKWINGFIGNWGWSIIALTVIINLIMFPLRHKSVVSMRKMQAIQPEVKAIQDRYAKLKATDPAKQKMNTEMMALYKERGVNPASGCVPILLTLPVLIAFYSLLSTAIELRGQPFFGWIHDLSQPDPYYIAPVLMGISQLWQQWITPQTGVDPAQQKMMMIMPLMFTFFFITAPAGVAIYWLMSNVWAIGQQYMTNYLIGPPNVRTVRPAAERRLKRAAAGKADDGGPKRVGAGKTEAATHES